MRPDKQIINNSSDTSVGFLFDNNDYIDYPIYRIFPIGRFFQILTSNQLTLIKPKMWDDPFENALLSANFIIGNTKMTIAAKDSVYGQCWTLHRESDAMWRIYSPNKDGIRVQTTPRKLLASLKSQSGEYADVKCFIGKVHYKGMDKLFDIFKSIDLQSNDGSGIARSLLYKRIAFSHEREIRLIYCGDDDNSSTNIFNFNINTNQLFESILFDPRMGNSLRKSFISVIQSLGCTVAVKRSKLYDPPGNLLIKARI